MSSTHPIDFVPNEHLYNVVACRVGFQFIQPIFELSESLTLCDVIYCQKHAKGEKELGRIVDTSIIKSLKRNRIHKSF